MVEPTPGAAPRTPFAAARRVLELCGDAYRLALAPPAGAREAGERIFGALETPGAAAEDLCPAALPVCAHLPAALAVARARAGVMPALADAFDALAPHLAWYRRPGAARETGTFADGHANAFIAGPQGVERRDDVAAGVSLLAPRVRYPDHHHPPEELYVVLTPGQWRQQAGPWHSPGPGGIVHNAPDIVHAMRAGATPLLAFWFLWLD